MPFEPAAADRLDRPGSEAERTAEGAGGVVMLTDGSAPGPETPSPREPRVAADHRVGGEDAAGADDGACLDDGEGPDGGVGRHAGARFDEGEGVDHREGRSGKSSSWELFTMSYTRSSRRSCRVSDFA